MAGSYAGHKTGVPKAILQLAQKLKLEFSKCHNRFISFRHKRNAVRIRGGPAAVTGDWSDFLCEFRRGPLQQVAKAILSREGWSRRDDPEARRPATAKKLCESSESDDAWNTKAQRGLKEKDSEKGD